MAVSVKRLYWSEMFFFLKQLLLYPTLGDSDSPTASNSADSNWAFSPIFLQILDGETEGSKELEWNFIAIEVT